jgi:hypothetical protein
MTVSTIRFLSSLVVCVGAVPTYASASGGVDSLKWGGSEMHHSDDGRFEGGVSRGAHAEITAARDDVRTGTSLKEALTFFASFDGGFDADFALGDGKMYTAPSFAKRSDAVAGLHADDAVVQASGQGRIGDALRFTKKDAPLVFFQAEKNVAYEPADWSGTVSFWLSLDPDRDLEPGFADPIMITPNAWNNAAFFVEFGKDETPRHFRLGVYADFDVWNPDDRAWEDIAFDEKPLVSVADPPFGRDKWTHVVFTFEGFNTGEADGVARLYLDGQWYGALPATTQTFTWDPAETVIALGLSYIGLFDELAVFNRRLTDEEVASLYRLEDGVGTLIR